MHFSQELSADVQTIAELEAGERVTSQLEAGSDTDWFRIELTTGQRYQFDLTADGAVGRLSDPLLRLYQNGQVVASNDDDGPGLDPRIIFVAPTSGTYYLEAASPEAQTGRYLLTTINLSQPTAFAAPPSLTDAIDWGTSVGTNTINVYFAEQGEAFAGHTSFGWTDDEIGQAMAAFAEFEAVTNLTFNRVSSPDQAEFKLVIAAPIFFTGTMFAPGEENEGVGIFSRSALNSGDGLVKGGFGFHILLHEFSHGLGLAHPHDTGGSSSILSGVDQSFGDYGDYDLNQGVYTILSYNAGYRAETGHEPNRDFGVTGTPSPIDLAVLQSRYGARADSNSGATQYELPSINAVGTSYSAIWDTSGMDWLVHNGSADATLDLRAATLELEEGGGGYVSRVDGIFGGFTIANSVVIESARGGDGNDKINGNDIDNELQGRAGSDEIYGLSGNDRLDGGLGDDFLVGGSGIDLLTGGVGSDTFFFGERDEGGTVTDFDGNDVLEFESAAQANTVFSSLIQSGDDAILTLNGTTLTLQGVEASDLSLAGVVVSGTLGDPDGNSDLISQADLDKHSSEELFGRLRDFDGNLLGGTDAWQTLGTADVQNDGDDEFILFNAEIGRWATLGPDNSGVIDFRNHGQDGDTRVVGVYLDPLVEAGDVEQGSDLDSARRFENDLRISNLTLLDAGDYDNDGFQQIYFKTVDGTAYLHALMHADGNIRYANYQSEAQMIAYLEDNGLGSETYEDWIIS